MKLPNLFQKLDRDLKAKNTKAQLNALYKFTKAFDKLSTR